MRRVRPALNSLFLACVLAGCAAPKYPIDATLSCDCAPTDQRVREIVAIAESSGYVRDPRRERAWREEHATERHVTLANLTLKSSSDINLIVTDHAGRLVVFCRIVRYYSQVTDAENEILMDFERRLAHQQPGVWTEQRFDIKARRNVDRAL